MPELEVTAEQARSIRKWANRNGTQIVSPQIDRLGSIHVIDGEPLLTLNAGFKNITLVATRVNAVITSEKLVERMRSEGVMPSKTTQSVK